MDNTPMLEGSTRAGTLGGTFIVLLSLNGQAVMETALLAALGATVSFSVSIALKSVQRWWQKR